MFSASATTTPLETLRDALYRGDWAVAMGYDDHRDPVVRDYAEVVHTISPTIRLFWTRWCRDHDRAAEVLLPLADAVLSTNRGPRAEMRRQWMVLDWLVRQWAPVWIGLRDDLIEHVTHLRQAPSFGPENAAWMEDYGKRLREVVWMATRPSLRGGRGRRASALARDAVQRTGLYAAWDAAFGPTHGYLTSAHGRAETVGTSAMNAARDVAWDAAVNVARATAVYCLASGGLEATPMSETLARLEVAAVELVERLVTVGV